MPELDDKQSKKIRFPSKSTPNEMSDADNNDVENTKSASNLSQSSGKDGQPQNKGDIGVSGNAKDKSSDFKNVPRQLILFGPPGNGKTFSIHGRNNDNSYAKKKLQINDNDNIIDTVFHPEYSYGDFMGRLSPQTVGEKVEYKYRPGHFLVALASAYVEKYKHANNAKIENVMLVIDEMNRGNAASIFGSVFNLLDRDKDGRSSCSLSLSDIEFESFVRLVLKDAECGSLVLEKNFLGLTLNDESLKIFLEKNKLFSADFWDSEKKKWIKKIYIPSNLYMIATINTSDESIYYMDSAFKRRWDWRYLNVNGEEADPVIGRAIKWEEFRSGINNFLKDDCQSIRRIEDKLIGKHYVQLGNDDNLTSTTLSKVMFHLWDSVFSRDKSPLQKFISSEALRTFGDFLSKSNAFVEKIRLKNELFRY